MSTIAFFPEGAYGPTNNCVGIGDVLRRRGHRVVFIVEESFAGALEAQGFEERLMRLAPPPETPEAPGQFWKDFIRETAPVFRKPTIEQLGEFIAPTFQVRIVSCNPTEVRDPDVPPPFSGYPAGDRSQWAAYWEEWRRTHGELHAAFDTLCRERGAGPLPELEFMYSSPWLNLTLYPDEADYPRARPLGDTWQNLQSSVRATDAPWELPPALAERDGPLVYLSLGSLGSADVELMQRLVDALADAPWRVIVSKGPQHELLRLPDTMAGEEFLPQTSILPQVDAVITHGGNNTVTESLHFGRPMVILPLFWDQYDNAQRVQETGFGLRLDTYGHAPEELLGAVDRVLADRAMRDRLTAASARLQSHRGTERAAERIEAVATRC